MAKTGKSKTTKTATQPGSIPEALAELQRMGMKSMTWMGTDWMERMSDIGSEALQFISERVKEDVDFQHKLLHCKDVKEMQHLQAEFLQRAIDQYTAETGKMIELGSEMFKPVKSGE